MNYELTNASLKDIDLLIEYKLASILDYAHDLKEDEKNRIINFVKTNVPKDIDNYKIIMVDNQVSGCVLVNENEDGYLLNELYVDELYRGKGIGTSIINDIKNKLYPLYLYVYKENKNAIKLYKKLGFTIKEETKDRLYMVYEK